MTVIDIYAADNAELDAIEVRPPGEPVPNVRRFLESQFAHIERRLLVHQGGQFYSWDGKCWPSVDDEALRAKLYRYFDRAYCLDDKGKQKPFAPTMRKVADLLDALRSIAYVDKAQPSPSWFGASVRPADEMIACKNGIIHWPTREIHPHTPRFYIHHSVPFAFDARARQPARWLKFLNQLWGADAESVSCLQELFGYLLSGDTAQQKMFLIVGPKRGGKGTIARVLTRLLGQHNVAGPTLSSLGSNFGLQDLIGKPVAIVSDARLGTKTDGSLITERLLSISGQDLQNVDRKFLAPWSGQLPTRFVVMTNELPRLADSSGALASRFVVLMLDRSFYGKENPALTEELSGELPAIFNWALDGLERLRKRGYFQPPASSRDAIQALEDLGSPMGAFVRDKCGVGPDRRVEIKEMYVAYRAWCEETGRHAVNSGVFGRDIRSVRPEVQVRQLGPERLRHYVGVGLGHSRDSRVNEHCSTPEGIGSDALALQSPNTRESREDGTVPDTCAQCGVGDGPIGHPGRGLVAP